MNLRRCFIVSSMTLAVLLGGCKTSSIMESLSLAPPTIQLSEGDNQSTVSLKVGSVLAVSLKANPTTGYNWRVASPATPLLVPGNISFKANSNTVGAPGVQTFQFKTTQVGNTKLVLVYDRSFEPNQAPINTFEVKLVVSK